MALSKFGKETWTQIHTLAKTDEDFEKMRGYDDDVTYRLVAAASEVLGIPAEDVMHTFGEYWVLETATKGYGPLLSLWGNDFLSFVGNLDELHRRIAETFTALKPPSFRIEPVSDGVVRVHYISDRPGLAPFVVGLLSGVGKRFDTTVTATLEDAKADGHPHDVFLVRYT